MSGTDANTTAESDADRRASAHTSEARHELAVVGAEVRRLVNALRPYGVLRRNALKRIAGAAKWHEASFERALSAAVEAGEIEQLPLGFYAAPREPDKQSGRGQHALLASTRAH